MEAPPDMGLPWPHVRPAKVTVDEQRTAQSRLAALAAPSSVNTNILTSGHHTSFCADSHDRALRCTSRLGVAHAGSLRLVIILHVRIGIRRATTVPAGAAAAVPVPVADQAEGQAVRASKPPWHAAASETASG
jgi:hypothetical protein